MRTVLLCTASLIAALASGARPGRAAGAAALYDRFCLACHGERGDGKGPAAPWLWPRPRDFTRGEYKWRTTPSGQPPTDEDLARAIRHGVPGTSMHAFGGVLADDRVGELVGYVKAFAAEAFAEPGQRIVVGQPPAVTALLVARGKEVYELMGCVACHGSSGRGDGLAAANLRGSDGWPAAPYDLTAVPFRRPAGAVALADIYASIATGLGGTPMPGFLGAMPDADLWAVAAYIDSIRYRGASRRAPSALPAVAVDIDRGERLATGGYWPGQGNAAEAGLFGGSIAPQGPPPASLAPAQASVNAQQCARCHSKQLREWRGSIHAQAASPGLLAQVERLRRRGRTGPGTEPETVASCQRCHAPLAEQMPVIPGQGGASVVNPFYDEAVRLQGINCAACHVRSWRRFGPPRSPGSGLLGIDTYPLTELAMYERSDFCLPCHQLPPRAALAGKPLLDTYREWLQGPYMPRGVQCQHCHMPGREHTWKGVHDPDTFRQGIRVEATAGRSARTGVVTVRARVVNIGAGHYLPTTPTPAAWLAIELVDGRGRPILGARAEKRIGRHLDYQDKWIEREDTRIPPGESIELAKAWRGGDVARATHARVTVRVEPDEYYEREYRARLRGKLDSDIRVLFEQALRRAESSHYVAHEALVPIE